MDKKTTTFIHKAISTHGDKYDYSKVEYVNTHTPVVIYCPEHGEFKQRPVKHTSQKCGCPRCGRISVANSNRKSLSQFINSAKTTHGDKYDYSKVVYTNNYTPVTIVCPTHGEFKQRPVKHTSQKCGCPRCALTKTTSDLIEKAKIIHNDKYDYSKTSFESAHTKTSVICHTHGEFLITPNNHLMGSGCPKCGVGGGLYCDVTLSGTGLGSTPGVLYFVKVDNDYYKIGITKNNTNKRLRGIGNVDILATASGTLYEIFKYEQQFIKEHKPFAYTPPNLVGNGHTECFRFPPDMVQSIIDKLNRDYLQSPG